MTTDKPGNGLTVYGFEDGRGGTIACYEAADVDTLLATKDAEIARLVNEVARYMAEANEFRPVEMCSRCGIEEAPHFGCDK